MTAQSDKLDRQRSSTFLNSGSTEDLIQHAMNAHNNDDQWAAVEVLWSRPANEVLSIAQELINSGDPKRRYLGVLILGQGILIPNRIAPDDSLALLIPLLNSEQQPEILSTIGWALGQIGDVRGVEPLVRLKNHLDPDVRYGVIQGLTGQINDQAVRTLVELSNDKEVKVRDWATFGLTLIDEVDTTPVRSALWARLKDENRDIHHEALVGLAQRGDRRVVEPLLQELVTSADEVSQLVFEAAIIAGQRLGDPRLYPFLLNLRKFSRGSERDDLEEAIAKCSAQ